MWLTCYIDIGTLLVSCVAMDMSNNYGRRVVHDQLLEIIELLSYFHTFISNIIVVLHLFLLPQEMLVNDNDHE